MLEHGKKIQETYVPEILTMGELLVEIMRPRPDMPLKDAGEFLGPYPSGAPAIFIDVAARLGCSAGIVGGVGNDEFGDCLMDRLTSDGVDCRYVSRVDGHSTAVAFVTYYRDGSRKFIYHIGNTPAAMSKVPSFAPTEVPRFFHVMGCSLLANDPFRVEIVEAMTWCAARGAKVSFDPNIRMELLGSRPLAEIIGPVMARCAVLHPGVDELRMISGKSGIEDGVAELFKNPVLEIIALKRGKKGCTIFTRDGRFDLGVYEVVPVDPTGAGDAFDAGFLCGLVRGLPLRSCAELATAAASLNTAAFGPMEGKISPATVAELMKSPLVTY